MVNAHSLTCFLSGFLEAVLLYRPYMLLLYVSILKFFQYPFRIFLLTSYPVICRSYHFEVGHFAQVLALQIPLLHFNNIFVRGLSCETVELGVQPDETVGKLVLLIVTCLSPFFLMLHNSALWKIFSPVDACWLASYPLQICISFWFCCHEGIFQLKD